MFSTRTMLVVAAFLTLAVGYYFLEGRGEESANPEQRLLPLKPADVTAVQLVKDGQRAIFERGQDNKWELPGAPPPKPTPLPDPEATPTPGLPAVQLSPSAKIESSVKRLTEVRVDRVIARADQPGRAPALTSPEYGLDAPRMEFRFSTKAGERVLAVGSLDPRESSFYVRRNAQRDVVLVSRYELEDIMRAAEEALTAATTTE